MAARKPDHTVARLDLPEAVPPGGSLRLDIDFVDQLPRGGGAHRLVRRDARAALPDLRTLPDWFRGGWSTSRQWLGDDEPRRPVA